MHMHPHAIFHGPGQNGAGTSSGRSSKEDGEGHQGKGHKSWRTTPGPIVLRIIYVNIIVNVHDCSIQSMGLRIFRPKTCIVQEHLELPQAKGWWQTFLVKVLILLICSPCAHS